MTADDYIALVEEKNPHLFAAMRIQMTPEQLRKTLRRAFDAGYAAAIDEQVDSVKNKPSDLPPAFEELFGSLRKKP